MKKLNISSAIVGLVFGLVGGVFVYLFVPPPLTASADSCDCPSIYEIRKIVEDAAVSCDCPSTYAIKRIVEAKVLAYSPSCASNAQVRRVVQEFCDK